MNCRACQDLLPEYALGELPDDELQLVAAHLRTGCRTCGPVLTELTEAWGEVALNLTPVDPPRSVSDELFARLRTRDSVATVDRRVTLRQAVDPRPQREESTWSGGFIAAVVLLIAVVGGLVWFTQDRNAKVATLRQEEELLANRVSQLQEELAKAQKIFRSPGLHFASLRKTGAQPDIRGYVVWDRLARQCHFFAFDLPEARIGMQYCLWLVDQTDRSTAAGSFDVADDGTGSVLVDMPAELDRLVSIKVTLESNPDITQPGEVRLIAELR